MLVQNVLVDQNVVADPNALAVRHEVLDSLCATRARDALQAYPSVLDDHESACRHRHHALRDEQSVPADYQVSDCLAGRRPSIVKEQPMDVVRVTAHSRCVVLPVFQPAIEMAWEFHLPGSHFRECGQRDPECAPPSVAERLLPSALIQVQSRSILQSLLL